MEGPGAAERGAVSAWGVGSGAAVVVLPGIGVGSIVGLVPDTAVGCVVVMPICQS